MADFDSVTKRFSGMGLGLDEPPLLPLSDGSIDTPDRQHFLDAYSGIAFGALPDSGDTKSSGRSATHRKNTIRNSTYRSGTTR